MPANETFETNQQEESSWMPARESLREQVHDLCQSACTDQRQKEVSFLRHLMLYDESEESRQLEEKIKRAERNERCVRRAMWVMGVLTGLALAGLGYSVILVDDFFENRFQLVIRLFCALGLASAFSFTVFLVIWLTSRAALDEQRERCRRLVTRIMEARLGKPHDVLSVPNKSQRRGSHTAASERISQP